MEDTSNTVFKLASDFINYTNSSVFLTGKAGTGKTTFLKHCKENEIKNTAIVAPTGVAAINAGGTTIHSFFQLPFTPFIPAAIGYNSNDAANDKHSLVGRLRLNNERKDVLNKLELLIIDEISMVRCDVLDAIDTVLRHVRSQYSRPFGGVQLLFIGDMYQLPPVSREEEWQLLSPYYKSPYFFNSHVLENHPLVYIELNKIYRQSDSSFVHVLNQVRNNEIDAGGFEILHKRYQPAFKPSKEENYITLTTHNSKAEAINFAALNELKGSLQNFEALIEGEFNERSFPADIQLRLKPGAQVMFIKNDTEKIRRYFNGKIGVVKKIEKDKILVYCKGDSTEIEVKKEKWKNIRYVTDKATNRIEEEEIGAFTQFPLRLAWAITIHKSQGLTFEKAIIDAGDAFAPGQVYVALSRCTNLEGMILQSRISSHSLHTDSRISAFAKTQKTSDAQLAILFNARCLFQQDEILKLFDFSTHVLNVKALLSFVETHQSSFNTTAIPFAKDLDLLIAGVNNTTLKFHVQLNTILEEPVLPQENTTLQTRITAAVKHFIIEFDRIKQLINSCPAITDSKILATDFNKLLQELFHDISYRLHLLFGCQNGFVVDDYLLHKRQFIKPPLSANSYGGKVINTKIKSPHLALYKLLHNKRELLCEEKNLPVYLVANSNTLDEMATYLPQSIEELNQISGFGPVKSKQFGPAFLTIIKAYCEEHNLLTNISAKQVIGKKSAKNINTSTKATSLQMHKQGKSILEIAKERNITIGTVEDHLTYFIGKGEIDINTLINPEKQLLIKAALETSGQLGNKQVKENLPETITYNQIRMVRASLQSTPFTQSYS
ncbi:MAG: helix-turn-helix domain-containing protein [Ferruginibacter sp.]